MNPNDSPWLGKPLIKTGSCTPWAQLGRHISVWFSRLFQNFFVLFPQLQQLLLHLFGRLKRDERGSRTFGQGKNMRKSRKMGNMNYISLWSGASFFWGGQRLIRLIPSPIFVSHPLYPPWSNIRAETTSPGPARRADLNLSRHAFVVHLQRQWRPGGGEEMPRQKPSQKASTTGGHWNKPYHFYVAYRKKNAIFTTKAFMELVLPCSKVGKRSHVGFSRGSMHSDRAQGGGEFLEASILQILHLSEMGTFCCPKQNASLINSFHNFPEKGLATEFTICMTFAYHAQS